jgi:ABC-type phosphate transport system substrate-binding protein
MLYTKGSSVVALALLFAFAVAPRPTAAFFGANPILAQSASPTFPLPDRVAEGTTVRIDGSNSMAAVNQSVQQRFEEQYAGANVEVDYNGSTAALQSLLDGTVDLVAIGRPLTDEEKAQGLTEVSVGRSKIAIIVGEDNPFDGDLTFEQFAQIFRGEITDWAEVGGEPGPIRLIDHPEDSDTRQAFPNYPVFQNAPFATGTTAVQLTEDSADAIISELRADGISYIAANQVIDRPEVRIIPMHQTLPTDPRYPYSQPLIYVYRGEPTPAVVSFLGFLTDAAGLDAVAAAGAGTIALLSPIAPAAPLDADVPSPDAPVAATPAPAPITDPEPVAPTDPPATAGAAEADDRGAAPWWLWLLPLLLGIPLLWWLLRGRRGTGVEALPPPVSPTDETLPAEPTLAERTGTVISADRTAIQEPPPSVPAPATNVPPAAAPITDATISPSIPDAAIAGGMLAGGAAFAGLAKRRRPNRIVLTPRTTTQAYAYWETPEENQELLRQQGNSRYLLRILDVTDIDLEQHPPHSIQEFTCAETDRDRHIANLQSDRDYLAEIGYLTDGNQWQLLARSTPIRMPNVSPLPEAIPAEPSTAMLLEDPVEDTVADTIAEEPPEVTIDPGLVAGTAVAGMALANNPPTEPELEPALTRYPNYITFTLQGPRQAYAAWDVPVENQEIARQQGGRYYTLRVCDVTGLDPDQQTPHSLQQFSCQETDTDRLVPLPHIDRDYIAEIGYLTETDDWLLLARSTPVRVSVPIPDPIVVADGRQEAVEAAKFNVGQTDLRGEALADVDAILPDLPSGYDESQIFLLPRDPNWAYTYWDVPNVQKEAVRQQGGTRLALRFYDVTGINIDEQRPHGLQQYDCEELARDWYIPVPMSDRDYIVEIGYLTNDGRWLMMARSNPTRIPPVYPSDWLDEQFITVSWDDELQDQTLLELSPPDLPTSYRNPIYDRIFNLVKAAEDQRIAGSLFGSMQQVPEQAISSYSVSGLASVTESGIGMMSGIGITSMSGAGAVGMSGIGITGMSGAGMSEMSGAAISTLSGIGMSGAGLVGVPGVTLSGIGMSGIGMMSVPTMSGIGMSGVGMGLTTSGIGMSGIGMMSGVGIYSMSGVTGMSGVGILGMSGVGLYSMSGVTGMSGVGLSSLSGAGMYSLSGVGMSGIGMGLTMSGVGMSGIGMYSIPTMSGIGMSGIGMMSLPTMSGVGLTMSGVGMSGIGMYSIPTMSGIGLTMSGAGMSGVGMSGIGMYSIPTMSGIGMSGVGMGLTMSGVGMSGVGMYSIPTMSGIGMSGVGMGLTMSGVGMSGIGFSASMPPIRPRKFWLVANAELIVHGATEPDATVMIGDREIKLSPDGTFRFQVAFPDGDINYPVLAVAADGEQTRSIRMDFNRETPTRNTNTKDEAIEEWR